MVDSQIKPNGVTDYRILESLAAIPREMFVPEHLERLAYIDDNIEIAEGRFLINPMVFARLVQNADINSSDICLDIACGSGYSSVVLGKIAGTVFALEPDSSLADQAEENFKSLGADNILLTRAGPDVGHTSLGTFDVIILNGAAEFIPDELLEQLNEGGRLLAVICGKGESGRAKIFQKYNNNISQRDLFDASLPVIGNWFRKPETFSF